MPIATARPSTIPLTPRPVEDSKPSAAANSSPRSCAPVAIAAARGCSLARSRLAASHTRSASSWPGAARTVTSRGFPSVSVPVLSTTTVSTRSRASSASASLIRMPASAPRPVPTMIDIGVARPKAQGQAMISTATALTRAWAIRGSGPNAAQAPKVTTATAITAGTK